MTRRLCGFTAGRVSVTHEFKLADLWVGLFYAKGPTGLNMWVCLLPCLPIHVKVYWRVV